MELYTTRHASIPEAVSSATTEAAAPVHARQRPAQTDPRFTHQDIRELVSLTRSLGELAEQVSSNSIYGTTETMEQSLGLLSTGASRLSDVAEKIRERSNSGNVRGGIFWEHFDVVDLLRILMISTRVLVGSKPVKVEMVSDEGPLCMWSDSGKVMQIASNLLGNAARYTDRGRITLILGRQQDHLTLMVTDTGKGMDETNVKLINSRMNDRAKRRTAVLPACDKGLIQTRSLVQLLGGRISLASRWNEGTIVEVQLPLGPARAEPASVRELTTISRV
jgi:signal transduction histidine kinase